MFLSVLAPAAASADRTTPLLTAVEAEDRTAVQKLLTDGAAASEANRYGVTPLAQACQNGNAEIVALLLKAGADVKAVQPGGETALMLAARTGSVACVHALLDHGAEINATEHHGQTALMWAAAQGNAEVVELLLARGVDFRVRLKSGFNALLFAVREGRNGIVQSILKAGADVNEVAPVAKPQGTSMRDRTSALMLAVENAHFSLALELVAAGADPNDERSGFTPLHAVTWARRTARGDGDDGNPPPAGSGNVASLEFVREMVRLGAKVNAQLEKGSGGGGRLNPKGATPFLLAAQNVDLALLKVFSELGADPKLTNADHCTPLLASAGVGVTAPGEEPGTEAEALATLTWLLEHGADINAVDDHGETVMHAAAYKIMPSLVTLLEARGTDIAIWNRKNKSGWTPLMIAQGFRQGNFRPIAEMEAIISKVMRAHGIEPPPAPKRKEDGWKATSAEPVTRRHGDSLSQFCTGILGASLPGCDSARM
jgi:ankyrin repeat protein